MMPIQTNTASAALRELRRRFPQAALDGVRAGGDVVLAESNDHAPRGRGTLISTGKVTTAEQGSTVTAAISYDTPYAVDAHEDLDLEHDSGRTAKFLENAMNSQRREAGQAVAREIRTQVGG